MFHDQTDTFAKSLDRTPTPTRAECIAKLKAARARMLMAQVAAPIACPLVLKPLPRGNTPKEMREPLACQKGRAIIEATAEHAKMGIKELVGESRRVACVYWRMVAIAVMTKHTFLSTAQMGNLLRRDHSTIINAQKRAPDRVRPEDIAAIEAMIGPTL